MRAHILALLAAAPAQAAVAQLARTPFCQFVTPAVDNIEENHAHIAEAKVSDSYNATLEEEYHIDVYFHVVAKSTRVQDGYVKVSCHQHQKQSVVDANVCEERENH